MILFIFVFVLILRAIFWGLVVWRTHNLQAIALDRQARGFIATQKYAAMSFILETAFWFMLVVPNTPLSLLGGVGFVHYLVLMLFAAQIIPAAFSWMWWTGRIEAKQSIIDRIQNYFSIVTVALIILGIFSIIYTVLTNLPLP